MKLLVRIATLVFVVSFVIAVSACSSMLRIDRDSADRTDIRENYLQNNPDGPHNARITNGEVVKGMGVIEVLASWGLPDVRRSSQQTSAEFWTYYTVDERSQMVSSYDLVFDNRVLSRWVVMIDAISLDDFHKGEEPESARIENQKAGGLSGDSGALTKRP